MPPAVAPYPRIAVLALHFSISEEHIETQVKLSASSDPHNSFPCFSRTKSHVSVQFYPQSLTIVVKQDFMISEKTLTTELYYVTLKESQLT